MFNKARKKLRDKRTVWKYKEQLQKERKYYSQTASGTSDTDRKSRALTVGECCLKTLEGVGALNLEHKLIPGTLEYMINQVKVQDDTGRKGFDYYVTYQVRADEPAYTEEQIKEKVKDLAGRLKIETEELFGDEEPEEEDGDSSLRSE